MKLAPHHIPGTPEHRFTQMLRDTPSYEPRHPWPDDCTVQWGHGIAPATPFFEAFVPGTFLRGEGATIAEAENRAFQRYRFEQGCEHRWGRKRPGGQMYVNGAGWCQRCCAFRSEMFKPIVELGAHRRPLSRMEADHLHSVENDHEMNDRMAERYPERVEIRARHARLLRIRMNLYGVTDDH